MSSKDMLTVVVIALAAAILGQKYVYPMVSKYLP